MLNVQNPTAIIWTETRPAYQNSACHPAQIDIRAITSWIERELDLARIREFGDNWDGFEAAAPDPTVLKRASSFLRLLRKRDIANPPMRVVLAPDGSVAFEWADHNRFVQAEIGDSVKVEWMLAIQGEPTKFGAELLEEQSTSDGAKQGYAWQPAPAVVDEPAYASAQ